MLIVGLLYFALVFEALILWGAIYVVERQNPYNKFVMALVLSAGNIALSFMAGMLPGGQFIYLIGALVLLLRLLMLFYQLDVLRALVAAALTIGAPYLILPKFGEWIGLSMTRVWILLFGFPTAVVVSWIVLRMRKPAVDSPIPEARIERIKRAETQPTPGPTAMPRVAVVAPQPVQRTEGEPTLLT
jgi:hypothetical protein